jgi:hypothetical protein
MGLLVLCSADLIPSGCKFPAVPSVESPGHRCHVVTSVEVRGRRLLSGCQREPVMPDACHGRESKGTLLSILSIPTDP